MASASSASSSISSTRISVPLPALPGPAPPGLMGQMADGPLPSCLGRGCPWPARRTRPRACAPRSGLTAADGGQAAGRELEGRVLDRGRGRRAAALGYLGRYDVADLDRA